MENQTIEVTCPHCNKKHTVNIITKKEKGNEPISII